MARLTKCVLALAVLGSVFHASQAASKQFNIVTDVSRDTPDNVVLEILGQVQMPFNRSAPNVMDADLLHDFHREFSFMQDIA